MLNQIRPTLVILIALTLLTGLGYPLAMTGVAGVLFPYQAQGSLLVDKDGHTIGSDLIGQAFASDRFFHGRPSATTEPDPKDPTKTVPTPYAADSSGASNFGPTNKALIDRVQGDLDKLKAENPGVPVPMDLVTTSASGLDPHITPEAALFQVPRIVKTRKIPADRVQALVQDHVEGRTFGLFGEPRVNVLALNVALEALAPK